MKFLSTGMAVMALLLSNAALAETLDDAVQFLQKQWAVSNYQQSGDAQKKGFETLIAQADQKVSANPQAAEVYIWRAIINSTYAGVRGGLGALKHAKSAKADLEKALELDETALQGSAYTSLGTLYFNVPGWPIGFGDDKKAEKLLQKALQINPNGIDPNYFYADFLRKEKRFAEAKQYLEKALQAKPRAERPIADEGRKAEIMNLLGEVEERLR